ncbi:uncharacterized protein, partial [Halyomorpha halys]|uniref:uncharacterized protein n=1 Tax=Halyomorpha halys TaxID=286706 RepID=UPI0006D4DCA8
MHLIISKTRLAPLKTISMPRLELCAALLLAQTRKSISTFIEQFTVNSSYLFSDSTIVLSWLRLSPHTLKTFVANRVTQILDLKTLSNWYHVSSNHNPADIASRGSLPNDLGANDLWWHGPKWLKSDLSDWPDINIFEPVLVPETKPNAVVLTSRTSDPYFIQLMERISSFGKLCRTFTYMYRFMRNIRVPLTMRTYGPLTLVEINEGTKMLIRCLQKYYFSLDSREVKRNIQRLSPFVDNEGIIRVGGRLKNSPLPYSAKHPILLPSKSHLTKLIIDHYHNIYLHPGPQLLHSLVQRNYWIISGRQIIRSRVHKCVRCNRFRTK